MFFVKTSAYNKKAVMLLLFFPVIGQNPYLDGFVSHYIQCIYFSNSLLDCCLGGFMGQDDKGDGFSVAPAFLDYRLYADAMVAKYSLSC